jgi:peptidoglycan hydrolase-like protein with peptidoglycan-binding domain
MGKSVRHSPAARLRNTTVFTACAACLAIVSGLVGASLVKSPSQVAAGTSAPAPSVITAPVVRQVLAENIVTRGTFTTGASWSFAPASVAPTATNPGGGGLVVTGVDVRLGQQIHSGQVLAEVSGRPVYVLTGPYPLWRDLAPGESGKDVGELQAALAHLGYGSGADSYGYFGPGTEAALEAFYAGIGYPPPEKPGTSSAKKPADVAYLPMSEAWFVPRLPATVRTVSASTGQAVRSSFLTITSGGLQLTGDLDPSDESLVKAGMKAAVYSDVTGYTGTGRIAGVGAEVSASTGNGGAAYIPLQVAPDKAWPESLNGQNVQVTITAVTTGTPVTAVPVAALSYDASGQATVLAEEDGVERRIAVRVGMSADGFVAVRPAGAALSPGTEVVVGQ